MIFFLSIVVIARESNAKRIESGVLFGAPLLVVVAVVAAILLCCVLLIIVIIAIGVKRRKQKSPNDVINVDDADTPSMQSARDESGSIFSLFDSKPS